MTPYEEHEYLFPNAFFVYAEKIARFQNYIEEQLVRGPPDNHSQVSLLRILSERNKKLSNDLRQLYLVYQNCTPFAREHAVSFYAQLAHIYSEYQTNHLYLRYVPLPAIPPHIELFSGKVLQSGVSNAEYRSRLWSIVLSSQCSFANLIPRENIAVPPPTIFKLPATEKDNPLAWPMLAHEMGHFLLEQARRKINIQEADFLNDLQVYRNAEEGIRSVLQIWWEEIAADMLAIELVGPAYLAGFGIFATFFIPKALRLPTAEHPSPFSRFEYMVKQLAAFYPKGSHLSSLSWLNQLWRARQIIDHSNPSVSDTVLHEASIGRYPPDSLVAEFAEEIRTHSCYSEARDTSFKEEDWHIALSLCEQLGGEYLIASRRSSVSSQSLDVNCDIKQEIRNHFEDALKSLQEEPNSLIHIVSAGAMAVFRTYAATTQEWLDYQENCSLEWCRNLYSARLAVNDRLVAKSIEAATIAEYYRNMRGCGNG